MIRASRHRHQQVKIFAEMLAILVESQRDEARDVLRPADQEDAWASASEFCAALDRHAASIQRKGKIRPRWLPIATR